MCAFNVPGDIACGSGPLREVWPIRLLTKGTIARFSCAAVLLTAAALKAYQFATDPALGVLHGARWLSVGLVQYEVALALWLLSGIWPTRLRNVALLTFVGFASVSVYLGFTSAASCGCFGRVHVNPWLTAGLDSLLAILLWCWKPQQVAQYANPKGMLRGVAAVALLIVVVAAGPALSTLTRYRLSEYAAGVAANADIILLEPEKWVGNRFPLLPDIDIGERVADGSWLVVLYRHDCSHCQAVLPHYEQLAADGGYVPEAFRIALIEVPPYGADEVSRQGFSEHGRLNDDREWFVTTPAEIVLRDGQVIEARTGDDVDSASVRRAADVLRLGSARDR